MGPINVVPMLGVADVEASARFYEDALGLEVEGSYSHEGRRVWAHLCRGRVEIMLSRMRPPPAEALAATRDRVVLYLYHDDVPGLHAKLRERGCNVSEPVVTFYRMKEIQLVDPDGHLLLIGQDTLEPPTNPDPGHPTED